MQHQMKLHPEPFEKIRSGEKTVEVRLYDEKRREIRAGDHIEFSKRPDFSEKLETIVKDVRVFKNFSDLFDAYPSKAIATESSKEEWLMSLGVYYSTEDIEKYGACAIEIELT